MCLTIAQLSHVIYSQIRDDFAATALEVVKVGGIYALPSPLDKPFLTNVFDDVEAVTDCLGGLSIAQQPEKKEKKEIHVWTCTHADHYVHSLIHLNVKNAIGASTQTHNNEFSALSSPIKHNRVDLSTGITFCIV